MHPYREFRYPGIPLKDRAHFTGIWRRLRALLPGGYFWRDKNPMCDVCRKRHPDPDSVNRGAGFPAYTPGDDLSRITWLVEHRLNVQAREMRLQRIAAGLPVTPETEGPVEVWK